MIDQKITTKEWTHGDLQYHFPAIRDELKRQGYLPDTMKFADIREYPTTNTIKPPTKEQNILKAAQTPIQNRTNRSDSVCIGSLGLHRNNLQKSTSTDLESRLWCFQNYYFNLRCLDSFTSFDNNERTSKSLNRRLFSIIKSQSKQPINEVN